MYEDNYEQASEDSYIMIEFLSLNPLKLIKALESSKNPQRLLTTYETKFKKATSNYEPLISYFRDFIDKNSDLPFNPYSHQDAANLYKSNMRTINSKEALLSLVFWYELNLKYLDFYSEFYS